MRGPDPIQPYDFRMHKDVHNLTAEAVNAQGFIHKDMGLGRTFLAASVREEVRYLATLRLKEPWWKRIIRKTFR